MSYRFGTADKHFRYTADGRLQTATRDAGAGNRPATTWTYSYLNRGLLESETLTVAGHSFQLQYAYNSRGQRRQVRYPSARTLDLYPNVFGEPTRLGNYAWNLVHAPGGQLQSLTWGNGIQASYQYNTRQLRSHTRYRLNGSDLADRSLVYDRDGELASISDAVQGASYPGTGYRMFSYDALHRLTEIASDRYGIDRYSYDPLGNVRSITISSNLAARPAATVDWGYGSDNRVSQWAATPTATRPATPLSPTAPAASAGMPPMR